jgi:hypothetical protein
VENALIANELVGGSKMGQIIDIFGRYRRSIPEAMLFRNDHILLRNAAIHLLFSQHNTRVVK